MENTLLKQLVEFGLSDKEAKIYTTLLELEAATVFEVAKHSGINRSSTYVVLESLQKKGLVGISDDKKVRRYVASNPEVLLHSARRTANTYLEIQAGIETILPHLRALHKGIKRKPIIKVFEGQDGLMNLFEDSLNCREKKMRIVSKVEPVSQILPNEYIQTYIQERLKRKIKMYGIHPFHEIFKDYKKMDHSDLDEAVAIPADKYKAPADFAIYDNKVAYMTGEDGGFGVIIESRDIADVMKSVFDLAYEEAKRLRVN